MSKCVICHEEVENVEENEEIIICSECHYNYALDDIEREEYNKNFNDD